MTNARFIQCPKCGSDAYRNVAPESAHFVYDRICRDCKTRYTPPTPDWMAVVGIFAGLTILAIVFAFLIFALRQKPPGLPDLAFAIRAIMFIVLVVVSVTAAVRAGVRHFRDRKETKSDTSQKPSTIKNMTDES